MTEQDMIIQDLRRENENLRAELEWKQKEIELARRHARQWISVEDRLPEEDGSYLVTTNSFGDRQSVKLRWFAKDGENVDAYDLAGQKDVWYLYDIECGYVSIKTVTHWMPIPEPPKEVEE